MTLDDLRLKRARAVWYWSRAKRIHAQKIAEHRPIGWGREDLSDLHLTAIRYETQIQQRLGRR